MAKIGMAKIGMSKIGVSRIGVASVVAGDGWGRVADMDAM